MDFRKKEIRGIFIELMVGGLYLMLTFLISAIIMG